MAEDKVTIQVDVDAKDAQAALELFGKESARVLKNTEKQAAQTFDAFKSGAMKIGAAVASFAAIKKAIGEAVSEEKSINALNLAMASTGEYSRQAAEDMAAFAESLGNVSGVDDDVIRDMLTLAKSFGITNDAAKGLVDAATDLSAVTGVDLETAVRQLGGTLDGSVGKIGLLGADFRNLTEEQLKNGEAITLLNARYGDAAETIGQTFGASLSRLQNTFDDAFKEIGKAIIQDGVIQETLMALAKGLKDLIPLIKFVSNIAVSAFGYIVEGASALLITLTGAAATIAKFTGMKKLESELDEVGAGLFEFSNKIQKINNGVSSLDSGASKLEQTFQKVSASAKKSGAITGKALEDAQKKAKALADEGQKFKEGIFSGFGDAAETEAAKASQALLKSFELEKKGALSAKDAYDIRLRIATDFNAKRAAESEKSAKEEADKLEKIANEARSRIEKASQQPIKFAIDEKGALSPKEIGASVVGGLNMALKGKAGAIDAVSQAFAGIGDAILPGIGGAVGGLAQLLAQGPEATKKFIKEFIRSIPDIIEAIAESIPVVVEVFVDTMVNRGGAVRIGIAIAKAMAGQAIWARIGQELFGKSGEEMRKVLLTSTTNYITGFRDSFTQFFTGIGPAFSTAAKNFGIAITTAFNQWPEKFRAATSQFFAQLTSAMSGFILGFGGALNQFISGVVPAFVSAAMNFASIIAQPLQPVIEVIRFMVESLKGLFEPMVSALNGLRDALGRFSLPGIPGVGGGGSGGIGKAIGGAVGSVRKTLGFAQGGIVPMYAADGAMVPRGTDTVPAMLTPGEMIIPRDMVGELGAFLAAQNGAAGTSDAATLAAILSAVQAPIVVKTEAKVNQNAFADIILQLNRQNARLTA